MNKKFFAALASATMAFSATGSLAVFADEFTDEVAPVAPTTPNEKPAEAVKVVWNEENFGDLADVAAADQNTVFGVADGTFTKDKEIETKELAKVTGITLPGTFDGEVKGLEYFTGLTTFTGNGTVENTSLDFSANTKLGYLEVANGTNLRNITLQEAIESEDEDVNGTYSLQTLKLNNTKLLDIDLTEQTGLKTVWMINGLLKDIQLPSNAKKHLENLRLQDNMLESMDLKGFKALTLLDLHNNHIGMLDLTGVTANGVNVDLSNQTIYIAVDSASVNVNELYPDFDYGKTSDVTGSFERKSGNYTGLFKLDGGNGSYNYNANNTTTPNEMSVKFVVANPMYRLYNPNSGEHFYTKDADEQKALVSLGWNDEGYGWVAPTTGGDVYRLYNPNAGDHHYTTSAVEKEALVAAGWKYEGIGWLSGVGATNGVTVYRQYNPNAKGAGAHNYTMDLAENDYLVSVGWTPEGDAWKALK